MNPGSIVKFVVQALGLAAVASASPHAQQPGSPAPAQPQVVARLEGVAGNVLVSRESGLGAGRNGASLRAGTRVITAANSRALVQFTDGCSVRMGPNQRLLVNRDQSCEDRLLLVQAILPAPPVPPAAPVGGQLADAALSGSLQGTAGALAGLTGAVAILRQANDLQDGPGTPVSPN